MTKINVVITVSIALLFSTGLTSFRAVAYPDAYPTVETPTLMASLSPHNMTRAQYFLTIANYRNRFRLELRL